MIDTKEYSFYIKYVGHKVYKHRSNREPKKFKSGLKCNTVKGIIEHPNLLDEVAFIFEEDDSYVLCSACRFVNEETNTKTTTLTHKKNCLNKAANIKSQQSMIYDWVSTGQLLKQELWELINHCKMGISKNQIKKTMKYEEDPESVMG